MSAFAIPSFRPGYSYGDRAQLRVRRLLATGGASTDLLRELRSVAKASVPSVVAAGQSNLRQTPAFSHPREQLAVIGGARTSSNSEAALCLLDRGAPNGELDTR